MSKFLNWFLIIMAIIIAISVLVQCLGYQNNRITHNEAIRQFSELLGTDVRIVNATSTNPIWGDPWKATFHLEVDGEIMVGRCQATPLSPPVCYILPSP